MILSEAQRAILILQDQAQRATEAYTIDRIDRALDEILRNYDNEQPAAWQVRSAKANAAKVLTSRRQVADLEHVDGQIAQIGTPDDAHAAFEFTDWLNTAPEITDADRHLLWAVAEDRGVDVLANEMEIPAQRVRERISRARAKARQAYGTLSA